MRTTITLDDDVVAMIEGVRKREGVSFKRAVNDLLRKGLVEAQVRQSPREKYSSPVLNAGPCRYPDLDNVAEVLAVAEGEDYR